MKSIMWKMIFIALCVPTLLWCKAMSVINLLRGEKNDD